ncbi:MAG TPA: ATP-binding protein [Chlamydiales bacterium]|nr:ATP-binding protein [Chlamydiales bacterium]
MDPVKNPFSPSAGSQPPELVGRVSVLEQARILLGRVKQRRCEKSILLTGLRGVGKTVLLNAIEQLAKRELFHTVFIEAHENKSLGPLIVPHLRTLLFDINRIAGMSDKLKRGLAVLRSFISALTITVGDVTFGFGVEPEKGSADSGDLEIDLPNLFVAIAEVAEDRGVAVAILIDEIQYLTHKELGALIMAMHKIQQKDLPLVLLGAGLPVLPGLAGDSKSYAERLFSFPDIGALTKDDATQALRKPVELVGVCFEPPALEEIFKLTKGYPYFIQEWGYQAWNLADENRITMRTVQEASSMVIQRLDKDFFRVRFDRLIPSEKRFLRAMAQFGSGTHRTGDIAAILKVKINSLGPVRSRLIKKGMIYSPAYGDMAFTVPLFDEFMIRAMPELTSF